ncbi:hypothetical protein QYF36_025276 [Acer negundo]|nr:hypothetical protein QYF36_025276 [Acer negundo]
MPSIDGRYRAYKLCKYDPQMTNKPIFAISQLLQRDCVTVESQNFICATVESQNFIFVVNISLYCKEEERERESERVVD